MRDNIPLAHSHCGINQDQGQIRHTAVLKAEVLLMEEKGRADIIIHIWASQIRNTIVKKDCRNVMELLKPIERTRNS
jgi:hypothetical protein